MGAQCGPSSRSPAPILAEAPAGWSNLPGIVVINQRWIAAILAVLVAAQASAVVKEGVIRIKVPDSEIRSVDVDGSVPKNCDPVNFDAYCHNTNTVELVNALLVQEGDKPPYRTSCISASKWSRCAPLPREESYDARREKNGLGVYFEDANGKVRKQMYGRAAAETGRLLRLQFRNRKAPLQERLYRPAGTNARESVKCSFNSTAAGGEITVNGRYVRSLPSAQPERRQSR